MKYRGDKLIITKKDLKRRLIMVRGVEADEHMAGARDACNLIAPDAMVIREEYLEKYNKFRVKNGYKPLLRTQIQLVDLTVKEEDYDEDALHIHPKEGI